MKNSKPTTTQTNNQFAKYPVVGTLYGLFTLGSRYKEAQEALRASAQRREALISGANTAIEKSKQHIDATDASNSRRTEIH